MARLLQQLGQQINPAKAAKLQWIQASVRNSIQMILVEEVAVLHFPTSSTPGTDPHKSRPLIYKPIKELVEELDMQQFWPSTAPPWVNVRPSAASCDERGRQLVSVRKRQRKARKSVAVTPVCSRRYRRAALRDNDHVHGPCFVLAHLPLIADTARLECTTGLAGCGCKSRVGTTAAGDVLRTSRFYAKRNTAPPCYAIGTMVAGSPWLWLRPPTRGYYIWCVGIGPSFRTDARRWHGCHSGVAHIGCWTMIGQSLAERAMARVARWWRFHPAQRPGWARWWPVQRAPV